MQSDAEHQKDHADLGELVGDPLVGDISGRERADQDSRNEIADQWRKPQPLCERSEDEREHQGNHDR